MPEQTMRGRVTDRVNGSPMQVGDYVVVKKGAGPEEDLRNVGRIGIIKYLDYESCEDGSFPDAPAIAVSFKEGDLAMFRVADLEVVHLMKTYQAGELVTICGVQIVDQHGNVLIKPGSPAIVLSHDLANRSLTIGYMREDTKMMVPIRSAVDEKYVRPRENWDDNDSRITA